MQSIFSAGRDALGEKDVVSGHLAGVFRPVPNPRRGALPRRSGNMVLADVPALFE